jgi:hypothetical protein
MSTPWSADGELMANGTGRADTRWHYADGKPLLTCIEDAATRPDTLRYGTVRLITRRSQVQILPPLRRKPLAFLHVPRVFSRPESLETLMSNLCQTLAQSRRLPCPILALHATGGSTLVRDLVSTPLMSPHGRVHQDPYLNLPAIRFTIAVAA